MSDGTLPGQAFQGQALQGQALLPGYRRYVGYEPKDWRKWEDGRGQKIDAPKFRGRTSYGKDIPMPRNSHGELYVISSLDGTKKMQVLRRSDGRYVVGDFSAGVKLGEADVHVTVGTGNKARRAALTWMEAWWKWQNWAGPLRRGWSRKKTLKL